MCFASREISFDSKNFRSEKRNVLENLFWNILTGQRTSGPKCMKSYLIKMKMMIIFIHSLSLAWNFQEQYIVLDFYVVGKKVFLLKIETSL